MMINVFNTLLQLALNFEEIEKKKSNWKTKDTSRYNDRKGLDKNNPKFVLNVLYAEKGNIYLTYVWKHNLKREKQFILLIISNQQV